MAKRDVPAMAGVAYEPPAGLGGGLSSDHHNRKGFRPVMRGTSSRSMDFERLIKKGENPLGFRAQTPNGTAGCEGTGWNRQYSSSFGMMEVEPGGPWKKGRWSNRTGE